MKVCSSPDYPPLTPYLPYPRENGELKELARGFPRAAGQIPARQSLGEGGWCVGREDGLIFWIQK